MAVAVASVIRDEIFGQGVITGASAKLVAQLQVKPREYQLNCLRNVNRITSNNHLPAILAHPPAPLGQRRGKERAGTTIAARDHFQS